MREHASIEEIREQVRQAIVREIQSLEDKISDASRKGNTEIFEIVYPNMLAQLKAHFEAKKFKVVTANRTAHSSFGSITISWN